MTTDGSKITSGEASAGWLFWTCATDDDESDNDESVDADEDLVDRCTCLLCGTILVDGRCENNTSFWVEAVGKLTITILLQCLYDFLGRTPTIPTLHTCDNHAVVKRVNTLQKNNNFHTINNPIDGDILVPTAYWADRTNLKSKWVRGHAERRKDYIKEWTDVKWANDIADTPTELGILPRTFTAPKLPSPSFTTPPSTSMSGKIARRLADDINRRRGLQHLQKILRLEDDIFGLIDWQSFGPATNKFTKTVFSRAHLCKHVSFH